MADHDDRGADLAPVPLRATGSWEGCSTRGGGLASSTGCSNTCRIHQASPAAGTRCRRRGRPGVRQRRDRVSGEGRAPSRVEGATQPGCGGGDDRGIAKGVTVEGGQHGPRRRVQGRGVSPIVGTSHGSQGRGEPAARVGVTPCISVGEKGGSCLAEFTCVDRGFGVSGMAARRPGMCLGGAGARIAVRGTLRAGNRGLDRGQHRRGDGGVP